MSLSGAYDPGNIFAKILRGEAQSYKVYEDDFALSFLDVFPQSKGHTLVLPKAVSARNLLDLPKEAIAPLFTTVQKVARGVEKALQPDGIRIAQFNGAPAGQTVFHLHVHVIPIYEGRPLAGHGTAAMADKAELSALAQTIAAAIASS